MRKFLATLALLAVLTVSAFAATLKPYTSPKNDFTIQAPGVFTVEDSTAKDISGQPVSISVYSTKEDNGVTLIVTTSTFQYLVAPSQEVSAAQKIAADLKGEIYAQGEFQGATLSFIVFPDGSKLALITKVKGSEFFMVGYYAPADEVTNSKDEVKAVLTSFSTDTPTKSVN